MTAEVKRQAVEFPGLSPVRPCKVDLKNMRAVAVRDSILNLRMRDSRIYEEIDDAAAEIGQWDSSIPKANIQEVSQR